jgi:hypothetical protein
MSLENRYNQVNLIKEVLMPDEGMKRSASNNTRHLFWYFFFSLSDTDVHVNNKLYIDLSARF